MTAQQSTTPLADAIALTAANLSQDCRLAADPYEGKFLDIADKVSKLEERMRFVDGPKTFDSAMAWAMEVNVARNELWHTNGGVKGWNALEWAGAMCGEAGEAANVAKKILRVESGMQSIDPKHALKPDQLPALRAKLATELADTFIYLSLLAARCDIDLGPAIRETFNKKSIEYGFPQRM